ncbi:CPBP family intramembrane glutamic endopeptidase [Brachybacterium sp. P6-10-X1]|uniref:CPBP family intramembrane glutamic endopeptidase n=1 Tax=Brachybacterium sp. P6-10-X1 TaxID=1903186 RepID=UPI0009FB4137|nr:type II CAAX endopeptidase family protein [Brachybacterium sp. P6-10-X1]
MSAGTTSLTPPPHPAPRHPDAADPQAVSGSLPGHDPEGDGASAAPRRPGAALPVAFHRLPRAIPHRGYWWRPLVAVVVAAVAYLVMFLVLLVVSLVVPVAWPGLEISAEMTDPLNPLDQFISLGMLALMLPAVLLGTLAGYGRVGIAHSVIGRFRWGLLGRAAIVVVPVYLLVNVGVNLVLARNDLVVPALEATVLVAWGLALVLAPLQSAAEEYVFRVLPLQVLGTWLRWPIVGILLPVPLFVLGHGYDWLGQVDIALFAVTMGLLAWKTGGIEIPVLLHAVNNTTLFALAPLIPGFTEQGEVTVPGFLLATVPMLLLSVGIWWWFSQREGLGVWEPRRGTPSRR